MARVGHDTLELDFGAATLTKTQPDCMPCKKLFLRILKWQFTNFFWIYNNNNFEFSSGGTEARS